MLRLLGVLFRPTAILGIWLIATGFFGFVYQTTGGRRPRLDEEIAFIVAFAIASAVSTLAALAIGGKRRWALDAFVPMLILIGGPIAVAAVLPWLASQLGWTLPRIVYFPRARGQVSAVIWEIAKLTYPSGAILGAAAGATGGLLLLMTRRWPRLVGALMIGVLLACITASTHIEAFGRLTDYLVNVRLGGVHRLVYSWAVGEELSSAMGAITGAAVGAIAAAVAVRLAPEKVKAPEGV